MKLIPIKKTIEENKEFTDNPLCAETIHMSVDFYKKTGFNPPWIGYYVKLENDLVGMAAFKGQPINGTVEIAYGTFDQFQKKGIGTVICNELVNLSLKTDPAVRVTARTLPEKNFSTRILEKNNFVWLGIVNDPDDGEVWEWEYQKGSMPKVQGSEIQPGF